jgi:N-methylhydantoinase A/oxoprolinase/acetone carboxylase beta subunit
MQMGYTVGIDLGGTFTDCVAISGDARLLHAKTLSTHPSDPGEGVLDGIAMLAAIEGLPVEQFLGKSLRVSHGATIGTNRVALFCARRARARRAARLPQPLPRREKRMLRPSRDGR